MGRKDAQHDIISDIIRVAKESGGRIPSQDKYFSGAGKFARAAVAAAFGSWTTMLRASGLQYHLGKRDPNEIRKEAFEHLKKEIDAQRRAQLKTKEVYSNILVIGDLHAPYQHQDTADFIKAVNKKYGPFDGVVQGGDEVDKHALSYHDKDADLFSAGHELEAAIQELRPLYKMFPDVFVLESNHGSLVYRKAKTHGLPRRVLKSYREILEAPPGWTWHFELKLNLPRGGSVLFHHAYGGSVLSVSQQRGMSVVQFHHHSKAGAQFWSNYDGMYFACQAGCLVDPLGLAMSYGQNTKDRPLLGITRIVDGLPYFTPLLVDDAGRWTGRVP